MWGLGLRLEGGFYVAAIFSKSQEKNEEGTENLKRLQRISEQWDKFEAV